MTRTQPEELVSEETPVSFSAVAEDLAGLIDLLEARGIKAKKTRVGEYLRFYRRFMAGKCTQEETQLELLLVMREAHEWSWIYRGLKASEPDGATDLLRLAVRGPTLARAEATDTRARNIQLELRIASYFLQAGFEVDLAGRSDLIVKVMDAPVFIECKRLNSPRMVLKRAKEARRQLRKRDQRSLGRCYGLVVLDASRVIEPGQGAALFGPHLSIRDDVREQLRAFDLTYDTTEIFGTDKRLVSSWIQVIVPAVHAFVNRPGTQFSSLHTIYAKEGQLRWAVFRRMERALSIT